MELKKICFVICMLLVFQWLTGQNIKPGSWNSNMRVEAGFSYGQIVKHRDYFRPTITENSWLIDLVISKDLKGDKYWHSLYDKPIVGVNAVFTSFGDADIFGKSVGVFPFIQFCKTWEKTHLFSKIGLGVAYVSRYYNETDNSINNAVSVPINALVRLEFGVEQKLSDKLWLNVALNATHYSNTNVHQPNLGINLLMGKLGVVYHLNPVIFPVKELPVLEKKWRMRTELSYGLTSGWIEGRVPGREMFHVGRLNVIAHKPLSVKGNFLLGLHYEFDESIYRTLTELEENDKFGLTSKAFFTIGYELKMGRFGLSAQLGTYLYNKSYEPISFFKRDILLEIVGMNYYFKDPILHLGSVPYLSLRLKAHGARAHHLAMGIGVLF